MKPDIVRIIILGKMMAGKTEFCNSLGVLKVTPQVWGGCRACGYTMVKLDEFYHGVNRGEYRGTDTPNDFEYVLQKCDIVKGVKKPLATRNLTIVDTPGELTNQTESSGNDCPLADPGKFDKIVWLVDPLSDFSELENRIKNVATTLGFKDGVLRKPTAFCLTKLDTFRRSDEYSWVSPMLFAATFGFWKSFVTLKGLCPDHIKLGITSWGYSPVGNGWEQNAVCDDKGNLVSFKVGKAKPDGFVNLVDWFMR